MPKTFTSKQVIKLLQKKGFLLDHSTGSHYIFRHPRSKARVTIPFHHKDIPKGTLNSILRQAEISKEELK